MRPWLSSVFLATMLAGAGGFAVQAEAAAPEGAWMNGTNRQPESPLKTGPLTWTLLVDTYYGYAFNRPADHTVFPTTTAPRHNEFNLNLAVLGLEVTEAEGLFGKLLFQAGNYVETITGTDATTRRGAYSGLGGLRHVQQAYAGHHFPVLSGLNLVMGIFPAYIGLDSYIPQENWSYTHNLLSDFTPYYLTGLMAQLYPRPDLKTELWLVNGWQTLSKHGEGMGVGYSVAWKPNDRLSLAHHALGGAFEADQTRTRLYTDNTLQWKYAEAPWPGVRHLAIATAVDVGHNTASTLPAGPAGTWLGGAALLHRIAFEGPWACTLRGSVYHDPQKLVALALPGGEALAGEPLTAGELTATLDYSPSPWMLYRLEFRHDMASIPYIAGPGGLTAPGGAGGFAPDLRTQGDRVTANATLRF
ncbi:MAG: outer membrane beta-barrel protein [Candidatus Sericytochromatia bacterium]